MRDSFADSLSFWKTSSALIIVCASSLVLAGAQEDFFWAIDRIAIVVALSGFFIRMGNLMNSEIYGIETTVPWGFVFFRNNG